MKDGRVPAQLMRAMAAEAEAAREARAKVTNNIVMKIRVMLPMISQGDQHCCDMVTIVKTC